MENLLKSVVSPDVAKILLGFVLGWVATAIQSWIAASKERVATKRMRLAELMDLRGAIKSVRFVRSNFSGDDVADNLEQLKHKVTSSIYVHNPKFRDLHKELVGQIIGLQGEIETVYRNAAHPSLQAAVNRHMPNINRTTDELTKRIEHGLRSVTWFGKLRTRFGK